MVLIGQHLYKISSPSNVSLVTLNISECKKKTEKQRFPLLRYLQIKIFAYLQDQRLSCMKLRTNFKISELGFPEKELF